MKKVKFFGLALIISLAVSAMTPSSVFAQEPSSSQVTGWGGKGISLQVDHKAKVARFEFDCGSGTASHWVRLLNSPRFKIFIAKGTILHSSGIQQVGHQPTPVPAVYEAVIDENEMKLSIRSQGTNQRFELRKGAQAELHFCE